MGLNEVTLFYWTGWAFLTSLAIALTTLITVLCVKIMWWIVSSRESAFRASATALMTHIYFTIKYRYRNNDIEDFKDSTRIGDYKITVEKEE